MPSALHYSTMSDTLHDDLTDIRGIGDAKAEAILEVLEDHETESDLAEPLRAAVDAFDADRPGYAEKFVRRAYEEVRESE